VVLVDDGSPPEFDAVLARATALGDRIRLVRLPANVGTYAARNAGMDAAGRGFVAFQDSDDWSHPRRLELQVQPLLENRRLVATTSDGLAVTEDLRVSRLGIRSGRLNPSSLVFRRSAVVEPDRLLRPPAQGRRLRVHRTDPGARSGVVRYLMWRTGRWR
jgi:glycosyltransferase involved in cell wall biosynthesis